MTSVNWKGWYFKMYFLKNIWSSWNLKANPGMFCVTGIGEKIPTFRWGEGNTDYFLKWVVDSDFISLQKISVFW